MLVLDSIPLLMLEMDILFIKKCTFTGDVPIRGRII